MEWNWQKDDWPEFTYRKSALADLEARFLHQSGIFLGALKHVSADDKDTLVVDLMSTEALKTSEIEEKSSIAKVCNPPSGATSDSTTGTRKSRRPNNA